MRILSRDSMLMRSFPFFICCWSNFNKERDSSLAPVWIAFPKLPLQCYQVFSVIAVCMGHVLGMDQPTANLHRLDSVRICVEIDLSWLMTDKIWIGMSRGFWLPVEYERMLRYCMFYRVRGHLASGFSLAPKLADLGVAPVMQVASPVGVQYVGLMEEDCSLRSSEAVDALFPEILVPTIPRWGLCLLIFRWTLRSRRMIGSCFLLVRSLRSLPTCRLWMPARDRGWGRHMPSLTRRWCWRWRRPPLAA